MAIRLPLVGRPMTMPKPQMNWLKGGLQALTAVTALSQLKAQRALASAHILKYTHEGAMSHKACHLLLKEAGFSQEKREVLAPLASFESKVVVEHR